MDTPHQMRLLQMRLERSQAEADEMARIADIMANNLAIALNALQPHDPDMVRKLMGQPDPTPAPEEPLPAEPAPE